MKGGTKNVYNLHKTTVYKEITSANKNKILLISKYIDTTKKNFLNAGFICGTTIKLIRNGAQCFGGIPDFISFKVNHNQLLFSLTIYNIDGTFVAEVKDNKLISAAKKYTEYASDRFVEIYNDYHIPVCQILLDKKSNTITVNGLFFQRSGYEILHYGSMEMSNYPKPYLYLNQEERNSILDHCIEVSRQYLKPIEE